MTVSESSAAASRLCAQCGLCCNGVLFHTVQLQPADSAKELSALGLKLKRKQGDQFILQPCPALQNRQCSIYTSRPERCRLFACRQLKRFAEGDITEKMALGTIREARRRVDEINELLLQTGKTNLKRPLSKRCEKAMAEPLTAAADPLAVRLQDRLTQALQELDALLDDEFRIPPDRGAATPEAESVGPG